MERDIATTTFLPLLAQPLWIGLGAIILSILPGWGLVVRLSLEPLTKLLTAIVLSYAIMYLLQLASYLLSAPQWLAPTLLGVVCLVSTVLMIHQRKSRSNAMLFPWHGPLLWFALTVWILGIQSQITVYGPGTRFGDWHEHYERALLFLDQLDPQTRFLYDFWPLAARGPLFNAAAALLMSIFGREFWTYQILSSVFNTFALLPLTLLMRDIGKSELRFASLWSFVLLATTPFLVQQETYPVTRFFAVGFVLGGVHFYWLGCRQHRPWLAGCSFLVFAAGILAHYLTVIFAAFFFAHFIYTVYRKHWRFNVILYPTSACALLLATWFAYLFITFGFIGTLTANSTLGDEYAKLIAGPGRKAPQWGEVFIGNLVTSTIPYSWRHGFGKIGNAPRLVQADNIGGKQFLPEPAKLNLKREWFSDLANNPNSLLGALGWSGAAGLVATAYLRLVKRRKRLSPSDQAPTSEPGWKFWLIFFLLGIPLNILAHRTYSAHGVAHTNLQPFICLTGVFIANLWQYLPVAVKTGLLGGFLVETSLINGATIALQARSVPIELLPDGKLRVLSTLAFEPNYVNNYILKLLHHEVFLSDRLGDLAGTFPLITTVLSVSLFVAIFTVSLSATRQH